MSFPPRVIPAKAGIYDESFILFGFPIKAFGNDSFSHSVGVLLYAKLLRYLGYGLSAPVKA